jgi:hypothetical protein
MRGQEESPFFVKKEAKKLLSVGGGRSALGTVQKGKSFLVLFFKKEPLTSAKLSA